ncbi:LysM peptidoglycan-binding domain-containing protein [Martelella endophytica]|uniref:LysM peptidoglycan-binding domain-containing protein n=1 Tax=Martelella endophytica TaxID=1486262 RepID=UPI000698DDCA|nr:LysM peptidoglycan-binding domain-containing protein [Martelella endophytica]
MKSNNRTLGIVIVILLVLIAIGAYFVMNGDKDDAQAPPAPVTENQPAAEDEEPAATSEPANQADATGNENQEAAGQDDSAQQQGDDTVTGLRIPTFDVLRVEPDGTAVIAGAAEPKGRLDVMEDDSVLTTADVGDSGDFVAIIDTPLTPGDHLIYLDVSMPDGRKARSLQTATISIPEAPGGELLALITEPGKASDIVQMPEADSTGGIQVTTRPEQQPETESSPQDETAARSPRPTADTELPSVDVNTDAEISAESQTENRNQQTVIATVTIKAVEIEGNRLFIAGEGKTGATVRGYIDDTVLSDSEVNVEGNFVVESEVDVAVGMHTVRIDMLGEDGSVIARAIVPFDRPPGDQVAAVSTAPAGESETQDDGTQTFMQPQLQGSDNAVIIRRGDNLWRISRRLYGRGVRYTTIYLANEPQIVNPNIILPGQVFSVPVDPLPIGEAETIHRRLLQGEPVGPEYQLPAGDNPGSN